MLPLMLPLLLWLLLLLAANNDEIDDDDDDGHGGGGLIRGGDVIIDEDNIIQLKLFNDVGDSIAYEYCLDYEKEKVLDPLVWTRKKY